MAVLLVLSILFLFYRVAEIELHSGRGFFICGMWELEESFEGKA